MSRAQLEPRLYHKVTKMQRIKELTLIDILCPFVPWCLGDEKVQIMTALGIAQDALYGVRHKPVLGQTR